MTTKMGPKDWYPTRDADLRRLKAIEKEAEELREKLGISKAGEVIWQSGVFDGLLLVEATGDGSAVLMYVEGNYPMDYISKEQKKYTSEERATDDARRLMEDELDWNRFTWDK